MTRTSFHNKCVLISITLVFQLSAATAMAQTTGFTYQGRLTDGGTAANGTYDLQFRLFDAVDNGTQQPQPTPVTVTLTNVSVSGGIFTVQLDFGANAFPGANRFLEISARPSGAASFTLLTPRQPITSTPYAVRSLNATTADSVPASGIPAGSGNYIQNQFDSAQVADFHISGNGRIGKALEVEGQGSPVAISGANSTFGIGVRGSSPNGVGVRGGGANPGSVAIHATGTSWFTGDTTPLNSSFNIGSGTGVAIGSVPASNYGYIFAGDYSANQPRTLVLNQAGGNVGIGTTTPTVALDVNGVGVFRPLGLASPRGTTFGAPSGETGMTITGPNNRADVRFDGLTLKLVAALNTGPPSSTSGVAIDTAGNVGIGTTAPTERLSVNGNLFTSGRGEFGSFLKLVQIDSGFGAGTVQLCRNAANVIAVCTSSSLRYKERISSFSRGLDLIRRLRPISFTWKADGSRDLGLGAEDVAKVEPLLVTHNNKGEIEGVKYDRLNMVLINAIKQQQDQIEVLQQQIAALTKLVCQRNPRAHVCKQKGGTR